VFDLHNLRARTIFRLDTIQRHYRLWRIVYERGNPGQGKGYSVKVAIGLARAWWRTERQADHDIMVTIAGLRLHYSRSYGGYFV